LKTALQYAVSCLRVFALIRPFHENCLMGQMLPGAIHLAIALLA